MSAVVLALLTKKYGRKPTADEIAKELNGIGLISLLEGAK